VEALGYAGRADCFNNNYEVANPNPFPVSDGNARPVIPKGNQRPGSKDVTALALPPKARKNEQKRAKPSISPDVVVKRWQQLSGQQARLDGDGRTFAEIEAERHEVVTHGAA